MFSKISRYRKLPDVIAEDAKGRSLPSRQLRLLPVVVGSFLHTVTSSDRLDQLAYQYYSQQLQWWNIADANPEFISPLALLGQGAMTTTRFPVAVTGTPPWASLFPALDSVVGVENVDVEETSQLVQQLVTVGGQTIFAFVEQIAWAVVVTYNGRNTTAELLAAAIEAEGFQVMPFVNLNQVGQQITIPPKPIG